MHCKPCGVGLALAIGAAIMSGASAVGAEVASAKARSERSRRVP
jgi:hypothetical protein